MTKPTTMRRLRQQARGEQRIAAILQAAAQVFYEVGFGPKLFLVPLVIGPA